MYPDLVPRPGADPVGDHLSADSRRFLWRPGSGRNPAISLEFSSAERIVAHRIRVVRGHFERPVLFTHEETGNYVPQIIFFPLTGDPILSRLAEQVKVRLGSGEISFPQAYFENWLDPARFVPHAIELSDDQLSPLFVRTSGSPSKVFVISGDYDRRDE